tara:strand:+ start:1041 stop:1862 length:822 start_codon:yes stop_codon:yes gene_type:complete
MDLFKDLNYESYLLENPLNLLLGINLENYGDVKEKITRSPYETVSNSEYPNSTELDDLIRLHYLVRSRKVTTILEIGVGKSTAVFSDALSKNKDLYSEYVAENLRRSNPFECHSVDNNEDWINAVKLEYIDLKNVTYHFCKCEVSSINSRICTLFHGMPNICPDLIYLDGPDQFSPEGDIRGLSTGHPDRMPMSGDIITIEHFLTPGTLIVVDGRTANARFIKENLQRNWHYLHVPEYDQHFFELHEDPLGVYNRRQIEFCLGEDWEGFTKQV